MLVVSWIFWIVPAVHCTSSMCLGIQKTEDANKSPLCNNTILCESKPLIKICVVLKTVRKPTWKIKKKKEKKKKKLTYKMTRQYILFIVWLLCHFHLLTLVVLILPLKVKPDWLHKTYWIRSIRTIVNCYSSQSNLGNCPGRGCGPSLPGPTPPIPPARKGSINMPPLPLVRA